jgi:hypothetical protein
MRIKLKISKKYISNCRCSDIFNLPIKQDCNKNEKYYVLLAKSTKNYSLVSNNFSINLSYISECELHIGGVLIDKYFDTYNQIYDIIHGSKLKLNDTQIFYLNKFSMNQLETKYDINFVIKFNDIQELLIYKPSLNRDDIIFDFDFDLYLVCLEISDEEITKLNKHKFNVLAYNNSKNICEKDYIDLKISKSIKHNIKATRRLYNKLNRLLIKNKNRKIKTMCHKIMLCEKEKIYCDMHCEETVFYDLH